MRPDNAPSLREPIGRLALLARISQRFLLAEGDERRTLCEVFEQLATSLGHDLFLHYRPEERHADELRLVAATGLSPAEQEALAVVRHGSSLSGRVAAERAPLVLEDLPQTRDPADSMADPAGLRCYVGLPLMTRGTLVGTMALASRRRTHLWEGELQLIQTICDMAAAHVARAQDERRLRESEQRLRDRETHLRLAMGASLAIAFEWDIPADRVRRLQSREEVLPETGAVDETLQDVANVVHPDDRAAFLRNVDAAMAAPDGGYQSLHRVIRQDGTIRWLQESGRVEFDDRHRPRRLIGISQDVTDRESSAQELRAQAEFTRRVTDVAPSILYVYDLHERRNVWGNREMFATLGYSRGDLDDLSGRLIHTLLHPDDRPRYREHLHHLLTLVDDDVSEFEYRMRHADGTWRWLHSREMIFRRTTAGIPRQIVGSALDITERRRAEDDVTFLAELNDALAAAGSSEAILNVAGARIAAHVHASGVCLSDVQVADGTRTVFHSQYVQSADADHDVPGSIRDLTSELAPELDAGRAVAIDDVGADARTASRASEYRQSGIGSLLLAPLVSDTRWVLLVTVFTSAPHPWHPREVALMREVAARIHLRLDRARAEEALRSAHATFRHLVEHSPFGVYAVDADFRLVQVSAGAQRVFENVRPLLGRDFAEVMRAIWPEPFATGAIARFRHTLATGESYHAPSTVERRRDSGVVESYDWKIERVTLPDRRPGVVCHFYDLSERQRYEAALRAADRQKDEFLAMLAHELRNPLAPIRASVAVMRARGPVDEVLERCRSIIDRQAAHMARLLDDLLDVSRLSRGRLILQRAPLLLGDVLDAAIETARPLMEQHKQSLHVDGADGPLIVDGDNARLTQVFANLLNNAAKYSAVGSRIDLVVRSQPDAVTASVRDTGIGIAPDMLERVFDLFTQEGEARAHAPGGLGIGLSLARRLVEMHGGTLSVRSHGHGHGSEFSVTLPRLRSELNRLGPVTETAPPLPANAGCRVLVADDNADAADTTALLIEALGCTVRTVYSGAAAVMESARFHPDLVLLDLGMPDIDGYEACLRIRNQPGGGGLKVVAVSGWGQDTDRQRSATAGFDRHLLKPVDPAVFAELVHDAARGTQQSPS